MALETANNVSELNEANPTSSDLVKSADDHIRMMKRVIKQGYQGSFTTLATVRALTASDGAFFAYNGSLYLIVTSSLEESLPEMIKLDNDKVAVRYSAAASGKNSLLPTNATQRRYPRVERILTGLTTFDTTTVNAAFGGTPIAGDIAIVVGDSYSETRIFTTSWVNLDGTLFGYQAVAGTLAAISLLADLGIFDRVRTQRIEMLSSTYLEVISPDGFGPDNLRYWFGFNTGVVNGNGEIAYNALSKTNAIEWKSMTSGTTNGDGTPVDGGAVLASLGMGSAYETRVDTYNSASAEENASFAFGVDGTFTVMTYGDITAGSPASGAYVTTPSNATGFLYEIKFEQVSGSAVTGTLNTWLTLGQPRAVTLSVTRDTPGTSEKIASIKMTVRKIGDAGTEQNTTVSLKATATCHVGAVP